MLEVARHALPIPAHDRPLPQLTRREGVLRGEGFGPEASKEISIEQWMGASPIYSERMQNALNEMVVDGINTNILLHREIFQHAAFKAGGTDIHYLEKRLGLV